MEQKVGFVSTRFAGTDGVSLESLKWAKILEEMACECYWFAGKLDRDMEKSMLVPEAFFEHPDNVRINEHIWGTIKRPPEINQLIRQTSDFLKERLYDFVKQFYIDILVIQNALTIPMHVPLGIAITEFLAETGIPTIAHHHDFYWERTRFSINAVRDYIDMAFPPSLPSIQHAVINSSAQDQLAWRKGLSSTIVPNVYDFDNPPGASNNIEKIRKRIGLKRDDVLILQPTRVVPRKGIEHAITLVSRLDDPRYKLYISHESGDEGDVYLHALQDMANSHNVELRFVKTSITRSDESSDAENSDQLSLWDVYRCAELVTFPSLYEGFGNAFLEAFYFKKPILVNRYSIWVEDIEPKGFKTILMDGYITSALVKNVKKVLGDASLRQEMTEHNYELARRHYSYQVLERKITALVRNVTGMD